MKQQGQPWRNRIVGSGEKPASEYIAHHLNWRVHPRAQQDALEGVLVPVTARWNEELLKMAGFTQVDCFWRWMNFAGWLAVK